MYLSSKIKNLAIEIKVLKLVYILALIINVRIANIKANFLLDYNTYLYNSFFYYNYNT